MHPCTWSRVRIVATVRSRNTGNPCIPFGADHNMSTAHNSEPNPPDASTAPEEKRRRHADAQQRYRLQWVPSCPLVHLKLDFRNLVVTRDKARIRMAR